MSPPQPAARAALPRVLGLLLPGRAVAGSLQRGACWVQLLALRAGARGGWRAARPVERLCLSPLVSARRGRGTRAGDAVVSPPVLLCRSPETLAFRPVPTLPVSRGLSRSTDRGNQRAACAHPTASTPQPRQPRPALSPARLVRTLSLCGLFWTLRTSEARGFVAPGGRGPVSWFLLEGLSPGRPASWPGVGVRVRSFSLSCVPSSSPPGALLPGLGAAPHRGPGSKPLSWPPSSMTGGPAVLPPKAAGGGRLRGWTLWSCSAPSPVSPAAGSLCHCGCWNSQPWEEGPQRSLGRAGGRPWSGLADARPGRLKTGRVGCGHSRIPLLPTALGLDS